MTLDTVYSGATIPNMNTVINGFPKHMVDAARKALAKAFARIARAAVKTGQSAPLDPTLTVISERVESRCNKCHCVTAGYAGGRCLACQCGYLVSRVVVDLEIVADRPALAGWEFLACVEPLTGGNLIKQVPGATVADGELAPWREGAIRCDHCGTARRRTETFIVRADGSDPAIPAGTYKQVGRNCLEAFLGGKSAAAIIAMIGWPKIVESAGDDGEGGWGGGSRTFDPAEFLAWCTAVIRLDGWLSRGAARDTGKLATADAAVGLLDPANKYHATYRPTDEDTARGAAALAWARELQATSDYEISLSLVAKQEMLDPKHAGVLASAIPAHARALGREMERTARAASPSQHVGEVGAKIDTVAMVEKSISIASDYGAMNIVTYRDATGNAFVWKTGACHGQIGSTVKLRGTVKKHDEFRGEKQTVLTRCGVTAL